MDDADFGVSSSPLPFFLSKNLDIDSVVTLRGNQQSPETELTKCVQVEARDIESVVNFHASKSFTPPVSEPAEVEASKLFDSKVNRVVQMHTRKARSKSLTVLNFASSAKSTPLVYNVYKGDVAVVPSITSSGAQTLDRPTALSAIGVPPILQPHVPTHQTFPSTAEDIEQLLRVSKETHSQLSSNSLSSKTSSARSASERDFDHVVLTSERKSEIDLTSSNGFINFFKHRSLNAHFHGKQVGKSLPHIEMKDLGSPGGKESLDGPRSSLRKIFSPNVRRSIPLLNVQSDGSKAHFSLANVHSVTSPKPTTLTTVAAPDGYADSSAKVLVKSCEDVDRYLQISSSLDTPPASAGDSGLDVEQLLDLVEKMETRTPKQRQRRATTMSFDSLRFKNLKQLLPESHYAELSAKDGKDQSDGVRYLRSPSFDSYIKMDSARRIAGVTVVSESEIMENHRSHIPVLLLDMGKTKSHDIDKLLEKGDRGLSDGTEPAQLVHDIDGVLQADKSDRRASESEALSGAHSGLCGVDRRDIDRLIASSAVLALYPRDVQIYHTLERKSLEPNAALADTSAPNENTFLSTDTRQISVSSRKNLFLDDEDEADPSDRASQHCLSTVVIPEPQTNKDQGAYSEGSQSAASSRSWSQASSYMLARLFNPNSTSAIPSNVGLGAARRSSSPSKMESSLPALPTAKILTSSDSFNLKPLPTTDASASKITFLPRKPSHDSNKASLVSVRRYSADSQYSFTTVHGMVSNLNLSPTAHNVVQVKEPVRLEGDMDGLIKWSDSAYKMVVSRFAPKKLEYEDDKIIGSSEPPSTNSKSLAIQPLHTVSRQSEQSSSKTAIAIGKGSTLVVLPNSAKLEGKIGERRNSERSQLWSQDFQQFILQS